MPYLIGTLVIVVLGVATWLWWRATRVQRASAPVLRAHGAARCLSAAHLLADLLAQQRFADIVPVWDRIEMPLLEALPDCPADTKADLIRVLDASHQAIAHRDTQRRLMTMRNALVPSDDPRR